MCDDGYITLSIRVLIQRTQSALFSRNLCFLTSGCFQCRFKTQNTEDNEDSAGARFKFPGCQKIRISEEGNFILNSVQINLTVRDREVAPLDDYEIKDSPNHGLLDKRQAQH